MNPSNLLDLDYRAEATHFAKLPYEIVDVHSHINGRKASEIYRESATLYGVGLTYSMTQLEQIPDVREVMGDRIRFIAIPNFAGRNPLEDHGKGYIPRIKEFAKLGATIAKFWNAPRIFDFVPGNFADHPLRIDHPERMEAMQVAVDLGMKLMFHIADPDTWFATKYKDSKKYGTKLQHYDAFRKVLAKFKVPCIAAHMGGFSEDLNFLRELLTEHSNLYIDASATKWVVRELSKHPREQVADFFGKFKGRILFGSDIVTYDSHLVVAENKSEMAAKASNTEEAFDLYASRYWALRTLFESEYDGPSPIADPDLAMVDPRTFTPMDAPKLIGKALPAETLEWLYSKSAQQLLA